MISEAEGTYPLISTFSFTTRAGVDIMWYFMISVISSTFVTVAGIQFFSTTSRVSFSSALHFGHPVPKILISISLFLFISGIPET